MGARQAAAARADGGLATSADAGVPADRVRAAGGEPVAGEPTTRRPSRPPVQTATIRRPATVRPTGRPAGGGNRAEPPVGGPILRPQAGAGDAGHDDEDAGRTSRTRSRSAPADAARVARMATEVLVIDGRPRYHLRRLRAPARPAAEPLPVGEAVELGFTPCGLCEPDSALLADARRSDRPER